LHAILHGWVQDADWIGGRVRLRDLLDVARIVERHREAIDWPALQTHAKQVRIGRVLDTALLLAATLLAQDLPAGLMPGPVARLQTWRTIWQRDHAWAERSGAELARLARGLLSPRDAYALERQGAWTRLAIGRRRLARLGRFVRADGKPAGDLLPPPGSA
jgi:hypothetical protein